MRELQRPGLPKAPLCAAGDVRAFGRLFARIRGVPKPGARTARVPRFRRVVAMAGCALAVVSVPVSAQSSNAADLWLTLHGDPNDRANDLVEVRPEPTGLDQRVVLDLRVSRDRVRTSFRGQKYRSYYAKAVVDCTARRAWYLHLSYYAQPHWAGDVIAKEEYKEGEAEVLFKDMASEWSQRMVSAACKVRKLSG